MNQREERRPAEATGARAAAPGTGAGSSGSGVAAGAGRPGGTAPATGIPATPAATGAPAPAPVPGAAPVPAARSWRLLARAWFQASRPHLKPVTIIPVLVGILVAGGEGHFDFWLALLTMLGSLAIHAGTDMANDYYDFVMYEGDAPFTGGSGVIQAGWLAPESLRRGAWATFGFGALVGAYLAARTGWPALAFGLFGIASGLFYTAPPIRYGYRGLGEVMVGLNMGAVLVLGSYYVQTRSLSVEALVASLPLVSLVALILYAESIHDIEEDRATGKMTVAARLGEARALRLYFGWVAATAVLVVAGVAAGRLPALALVTLIPAARCLRQAPFFLGRRYVHQDLYRLGRLALGLYKAAGVSLVAGYAWWWLRASLGAL
ncbi:1,4-dihydroxy-2-naphthoateoctaprenyltransferase [Thermaerobacter marianensis DSM 12885]|uniref:1,4-dihydroxy-2-naphthoate octaprenyltransferase n=1 Tax=Thermaerobacter marianensis (strain ATCC 700841 / DSM 12885 / JCM 10246 / 7p75a) TaxID=644966 RepID=E6SH70_THEM7|nr:1,4-dihydroxy-2-naphthoate octaprenyltransferase [Thermaerobacter marianensis]ADU51734.1 1,4-dihydroxy-2-naphthoateoctaprenyltransferase [Thermaerobacter marianensis DSM 12885]